MNSLRQTWNNIRVGPKLLGFASVMTVGVTIALTITTLQRDQANFRTQLEDQATLMLESLSLGMRDQLILVQVGQLSESSQIIAQNPNITFITTYDGKGILLTDTRLDAPAFQTKPDPLGQRLIKSKSGDTVLDWQSNQLVAGRVVTAGNQTVGAVAIGFSTTPLEDRLSTARQQSVLIAALMIVLAVLAAVVLTRQLTQPLSELTAATTQIAEGKAQQILPTRTASDEIGQLALSFRKMAETIQKREADLRTANDTLEQRVRERTVELERATAEAKEASRAKDEFLSVMSHELRTPLNAVLGYQGILQLVGGLEGDNLEMVQRTEANARRLLGLINDVLDISRIEAGRMEIVPSKLAVKDFVSHVRGQMEVLATEKKIDFDVTIADNVPQEIMMDEDALSKIIFNLLGNAFKFTEKGKVNMNIMANNGNLQLAVSDTGVGIPAHMHQIIFERFRQVDSSSTRSYGGSGLGLSIVQQLCNMMGGTVVVDSTIGTGSTFTVTLPLQVAGERV